MWYSKHAFSWKAIKSCFCKQLSSSIRCSVAHMVAWQLHRHQCESCPNHSHNVEIHQCMLECMAALRSGLSNVIAVKKKQLATGTCRTLHGELPVSEPTSISASLWNVHVLLSFTFPCLQSLKHACIGKQFSRWLLHSKSACGLPLQQFKTYLFASMIAFACSCSNVHLYRCFETCSNPSPIWTWKHHSVCATCNQVVTKLGVKMVWNSTAQPPGFPTSKLLWLVCALARCYV